MSTLTMAMNRRLSYSFFCECMKRLPKMETIIEEVTEKEPDPEWYDIEEIEWVQIWQESHWGQWTDIEYIDIAYEPMSAPPPIR